MLHEEPSKQDGSLSQGGREKVSAQEYTDNTLQTAETRNPNKPVNRITETQRQDKYSLHSEDF